MTTPDAWLLSSRVAVAQSASADAPDLLRISAVVALVVVSVVALSFAIRPLLPPAPAPLTDAELDELTMRRLGLIGDIDQRVDESARGPADVIPFPRKAPEPRDPILDEDERLYRDPVVAARLRALLEPDRRRSGRLESVRPSWASPGPPVGGSATPPDRPWLAKADDGRRVRHTDDAQSVGGTRGAGRDQELPAMPPPHDMESADSDRTVGSGAAGDSDLGDSDGALGSARPPAIEGSAPSSADLDRLVADGPQPRSKVVPFIPRQQRPDAAADEPPVDPAVTAALTATVRELLFCANVGEYLHGFALYSDRYLFTFMDETGLTVDEFRTTFEGAEAKEADDWTRLSHLGEVRRLDDGRISALVTYLDGDRPGGSERYTFEFGVERGLWLIDDIQQV